MAVYIAGAILLAVGAAVLPCTLCRDGWLSRSFGRGTCSWHGGKEKDE